MAELLIEYPFPLHGGLAWLRLPKRLDPEDAARLIAFIQALVIESSDRDPGEETSEP